MTDGQKSNKKKEDMPPLELSDIVAFMIAAFQIIAPAALILMAVLMVFYYLVRWWAG